VALSAMLKIVSPLRNAEGPADHAPSLSSFLVTCLTAVDASWSDCSGSESFAQVRRRVDAEVKVCRQSPNKLGIARDEDSRYFRALG
jgi:hypothetical protein